MARPPQAICIGILCIGCFKFILYDITAKKKSNFGIAVELTDIYSIPCWQTYTILDSCPIRTPIQLTDVFSYRNITSIADSRHCLFRTQKPAESRLKMTQKWQQKKKNEIDLKYFSGLFPLVYGAGKYLYRKRRILLDTLIAQMNRCCTHTKFTSSLTYNLFFLDESEYTDIQS